MHGLRAEHYGNDHGGQHGVSRKRPLCGELVCERGASFGSTMVINYVDWWRDRFYLRSKSARVLRIFFYTAQLYELKWDVNAAFVRQAKPIGQTGNRTAFVVFTSKGPCDARAQKLRLTASRLGS